MAEIHISPGEAISRRRGMLLGAALADAHAGHASVPTTGVLRVGVATQLTAFTVDGLIRSSVRMDHKGICNPPGVIWHALCRWAALQGIESEALTAQWASDNGWPDGWLADVAILHERRGNAPATVSAVRRLRAGSVKDPPNISRGAHAVIRTLPIGLLSGPMAAGPIASMAFETAATTHGHPQARHMAVAGALLVAATMTSPTVSHAVTQAHLAARELAGADPSIPGVFAEFIDLTTRVPSPGDPIMAEVFGPDGSARSALLGGLYAAWSAEAGSGWVDAMTVAGACSAPRNAAIVTGAIWGALKGPGALPAVDVSRLELAWVLDSLGGDLTRQLAEYPSGSEQTPAVDPTWWDRYPGW